MRREGGGDTATADAEGADGVLVAVVERVGVGDIEGAAFREQEAELRRRPLAGYDDPRHAGVRRLRREEPPPHRRKITNTTS